ncbi:MAG: hypothetical protein DMG20_01975 [Acidobacteria bacterium]|nr:MAG: hypothetical protein DMG20_01975 [Acidobacteriota bacterium]
MSPEDVANQTTASGVRWLLLCLALAAAADLVLDVPTYFGTVFPALDGISGTASYQRYAPLMSLAVPAVIGVIGFAGILRIERGRGWTRETRAERARPAFFVAAAAATFLFGSGLALDLIYGAMEDVWNPVRMTVRFVVVLAVGVYLLETAARIDPGSRMEPAKTVLVLGVFAAAVRMLIAMYNGFVAANSPSNFVSSQVEPVLAPSAFLLAVFSLLGWTAVYGRILGRLAQARAGRSPHPRAA